MQRTDRFIAAPGAVRRNLIDNWDIPEKAISVIHEAIPAALISKIDRSATRRALRTRMDIPDDVFVIGGMGFPHWRKGTDLFIRMADDLRQRLGDRVRCLWVGGHWYARMQHFVAAGLGRRARQGVLWFDENATPLDYLASCDIFCLTSREDPYPLVMLEAAAIGLPIVGFAGSGGFDEFSARCGALAVPSGNVTAMSAAVIQLLEDENQRVQLGLMMQEKVVAAHDIDAAAKEISAYIFESLRPLSSIGE